MKNMLFHTVFAEISSRQEVPNRVSRPKPKKSDDQAVVDIGACRDWIVEMEFGDEHIQIDIPGTHQEVNDEFFFLRGILNAIGDLAVRLSKELNQTENQGRA